MATENIPSKDAEYGPWIINFASVATANATLLNLSVGQAATLTGLATVFESAQADSIATKAAAEGATATKRGFRTASEQQFRVTAKIIAANPNITDALKSELGLSVVPGTLGPVVPVIDLSATGFANGDNNLRWKRNGNANGTTFRVEAKYGASSEWTFVATTNRIRYVHTGQTPGVMVTYRIISQRGEVQSSPSSETVIYSSGGEGGVELKLAA